MDDTTNPQPASSTNDDAKNQTPPGIINEVTNEQSQQTASGQGQTSFSEEDYNQLKKDLEESQQKLKEMVNISQHALADLQNFKRRAEEERMNFTQYANAQIILDFLPALSNLERAIQHEPKDAEWIKGVEQILKQFSKILEKQNLKAIETIGQPFDPKIHEALTTGPGEKDMVLQEFEKGYMLGDRVLKSARVKVGNGEEIPTQPEEPQA